MMDPADRQHAHATPISLDLRKVFRPCPLCQAAIEVWEQLGAQDVVCESCGLSCTIDASPPPAPPETSLTLPIVEVSSEVEHWLEHTPKPIRPELTPAGRRARKRRMIAAAAGASTLLFLAIIAGQFGYLTASQRFVRQLAEQRERAEAKESLLRSQQQRLIKDRLAAELHRSAAEREARLMTARYFAAQSQDMALSRPWQSVTTAIDAVNATLRQDGYVDPEAHQSLRDAVARVPQSYGVDGTRLHGHQGAILALAVSRDGRWLATGGADQTVRLWDMHTAGKPRGIVLKRHQAKVTHAAFSHDSRWLITCSQDSIACIWELADDAGLRSAITLPGRGCPIKSIAVSPNSRWLAIVFAATEGGAETARLWDLSSGPRNAKSLELNGQRGHIQAVAISPDSRWLAFGVDDTVHMWDLAARVPAIASVGRQCSHGGVTATLFTNDGKWLVTSGRDGSARLWDLAAVDPSTSVQLAGHRAPVELLATSSDSRWLATAVGRSLKLWDLSASDPAGRSIELKMPANLVSVAFSDDGRWLAGTTADAALNLWAMETTGPTHRAVRLETGIGTSQTTFTPDSRTVVATGKNRSVFFWNLDVNELVQRAEQVVIARRQSIGYRYQCLNPLNSLAGRIWAHHVADSQHAVVWRSLAAQRLRFAGLATKLTNDAIRRWSEIHPQLVQRRAAVQTAASLPAASGIAPEAPTALADPSAPDSARYQMPRHATQGNTLRLYVR